MEFNKENNIIRVIKGVGISVIFTFIFLFIFSCVLTYSNAKEEWTVPVIIILTGLSILIGSSIANNKLRKNGMLNGGIISFFYLFTLYLISSIISMSFSINYKTIVVCVVGILFGMLGGIIGVNKK